MTDKQTPAADERINKMRDYAGKTKVNNILKSTAPVGEGILIGAKPTKK